MRPDNPNLFYALCATPNIGSIRESFFVSQLSHGHQVHYHDQVDFIVDDEFVFEIGGQSKTARQLGQQKKGFVSGGFEGGLTTRKYAGMTKTSRTTSYREITDLLDKKILTQNPGKGRSVS